MSHFAARLNPSPENISRIEPVTYLYRICTTLFPPKKFVLFSHTTRQQLLSLPFRKVFIHVDPHGFARSHQYPGTYSE